MKAMATRCDLGLYAIDYRRNYGSFVVSTILQSLEVHPGKQPSRITRRVTPPAQRQHYVLRAVQFHSDADSHFVSTLNNQVSIKPRGFTDAVNAIRGGAAIQGCFSYETPDYMTFEGLERRASSLRGLSPAPRPPGSAALHDASRRLLTRSPPLPTPLQPARPTPAAQRAPMADAVALDVEKGEAVKLGSDGKPKTEFAKRNPVRRAALGAAPGRLPLAHGGRALRGLATGGVAHSHPRT